MKQYKTIRIWAETRRIANIIAAYLDISVLALLDRLLREEAKRHNIDLN